MIRDVQHVEPVWRDRSDFIIAADIDPRVAGVSREQLWARRAGECQFEVCCIPFFLYDVALGDFVETDDGYTVRKVSRPSGRYVFRVWFGDSLQPRDETATELGSLGALLEWSSLNLLAVDARDAAHARQIADYLQEQENAGRLMYETGKTL